MPKTLGRFFWHFIKEQKWGFLAILILGFAWSLDNTVWPIILRKVIDTMVNYHGNRSHIWDALYPLLIVGACMWIIIDGMFRIQGFLMAKIFPRFEASIRMSMYNYVQNHSYQYFSKRFAGSLANRISDMTQSATRIIQQCIVLFAPVLFALLIASVVFYQLSPQFFFLLVFWSVLHLGISFASAKKSAHLSKMHAKARSKLSGNIVDTFANIINVKIFANQRYEYQHSLPYQNDERNKNSQAMRFSEIIAICLNFSNFLFPGVLFTWAIIHGWQRGSITLGSLVLIFNIMWNMQQLVRRVGSEMRSLYKELGICQQSMELLQKDHDIQDQGHAKDLTITEGRIEMDAVDFSYANGKQVFHDLTVHIDAGSKVGLVGFSGSGKSTFVHLLMRFFEIDSGVISIDGMNINDFTIKSLRRQISLTPQNPTLFHRTLRENIQYGNLMADEKAIMAASKHAHCHEFICKLPEGYAAMAGERGVNISGGERQRIAIARSFLENAPILILDEATSALDAVTEQYIQDALSQLMQGRTTLVIAHRLSTIMAMDRILVFHQGQIIEDGRHEDLIQQGGHYAMMWRNQSRGFLPEEAN